MEAAIAAGFGRYMEVQRGKADEIAKACSAIFHATAEMSQHAPDTLIVTLCKPSKF